MTTQIRNQITVYNRGRLLILKKLLLYLLSTFERLQSVKIKKLIWQALSP